MFYKSLVILVIGLFFSGIAQAVEKHIVMGAGPSTFIVTLFFKHFSETDAGKEYEFEVIQRSIKHAGGIKASDNHLFGRTGRPLNKTEKSLNKNDLFLARIPVAIVVGDKVGVDEISLEQLRDIFKGDIANWKQLGGPDKKINLAGRESTEATLGVLKENYDYFSNVRFDKVFTRDHQVVNYLKSRKGSYAISFGAKSNFDPRNHLKVNGFDVGINIGLVYDDKNMGHSLVEMTKRYSESKAWQEIVSHNNQLLPKIK